MSDTENLTEDELKISQLFELKDNLHKQLDQARKNVVRSTIDCKNIRSLLAGTHDEIMVLERKGVKRPVVQEEPKKTEEAK